MRDYISLTVRERAKGNWQWMLELPSSNQKRQRPSGSGYKTKKEAKKAGEEAKRMYETNPNFVKKSEMTFSQLIDIWYEDYCVLNLKHSTCMGYKKKFGKIKEKIGDIKIIKINTCDLQNFINYLIKEKIARNSLSTYKGILTSSLNYAIQTLSIISYNPAKQVTLPKKRSEAAKKAKKHPNVALKDEDVKAILQRFPEGTSAHIPIVLCYRLGLRRGEAFGLAWKDIDFHEKTVRIKRQMQYNEATKKWYMTEPKYESYRTIALDDKTIELLKREKSRQKENRQEQGDRYLTVYVDDDENLNYDSGDELDLVNVRENGAYITTNICEHTSTVIKKKLGIKEFTMHSLRHTNATKLLESGANVKAVQERLGHKNIKETMDIYAHCTITMKENTRLIANNIF